jgi:hypothetical protein
LVEIGSVVSEEICFIFYPPFFLFLAWRPSWLEVGITGHKFGRGPSKDYSSKVWLQLAQWFLRRRFLCEFSIGFYVKLFYISSPLFFYFSLAAILVGSRDHRTQIWKGAIQGLFHQSLVAIGPVVSEEKIFM